MLQNQGEAQTSPLHEHIHTETEHIFY